MSDYTKTTNFTAKDALSTGDPDKLIKGSLFDTEFDNIATAIGTKHDSNDFASQAQAEAATSGSASNTTLLTPLRLWNWASANAGVVEELQTLADPGADRILFWDDGEAAGSNVAYLTVSNGLSIAATTLGIDDTAAGAGLTASSGVLAVGAGNGITVNADDVALTDAAASTTNLITVSSGTIAYDPTSLTQITGASIVGADEFVLWDADAGAAKALRWQDFGIPVVDDSTTAPMSSADLTYANKWYSCSNASPISFVIPANASVAYPVGTVFAVYQAGVGQVTVSVTTDTLRAPNGAKTANQYSTVFVTKVASTTWVLTGDAAT